MEFEKSSWDCERISRTKRKDIRNKEAIFSIFESYKPAAVIHCAAQPSHHLAAKRPFDDFGVNANGTLNLLEATRGICQGISIHLHEHQ